MSPICGFGCYLLCSVGLTFVGLGAGLAKPSAVWFVDLIDSSASIKCLFWMVGLAAINPDKAITTPIFDNDCVVGEESSKW